MAEGGGLLNRYTAIIRIVDSNPIPSATSAYRVSRVCSAPEVGSRSTIGPVAGGSSTGAGR